MRKMLLVAITLTLMTSAVAQADEVVEVYIGENHCQGVSSKLTERSQSIAEEKCLKITGYPNAQLIGEPVYKSNISGWGGTPGCTVIISTTMKANFQCLNKNK